MVQVQVKSAKRENRVRRGAKILQEIQREHLLPEHTEKTREVKKN